MIPIQFGINCYGTGRKDWKAIISESRSDEQNEKSESTHRLDRFIRNVITYPHANQNYPPMARIPAGNGAQHLHRGWTVPPAAVASAVDDEDPVSVTSAWSVEAVHPTGNAVLAVVLDIRNGYHIMADKGQLSEVRDFKPFPTRVW